MNKETSKSVERINQLEEALRGIVKGDMRLSKTMARCALEGTFPPVDEKPEQEAKSHGDVYAVHDASCKTVAHFEVDEKGKYPTIVKPIEPTPWSDKSAAYWHEQYQLMREKYWKQMGENSEQADRIVQLEAALDAMVEGVASKSDPQQAERIRELEEQQKVRGFLLNGAIKDLETEQAEKRELYAMLRHIVDWNPELPDYTGDKQQVLFKNAFAAARELLSKCKVKEGK